MLSCRGMLQPAPRLVLGGALVAGIATACGAPASHGPVAPLPSAALPPRPLASNTTTAQRPSIVMAQLSPGEATCGLDGEGRVWKWNGGEMEPDAPEIVGARSIGCGMLHTCVVAADESVSCWGNNAYGGLGDGTEKNRDAPVRVVGLSSVAEIGVDYARACARTTKGDVYCWGDSEFGKAGDGRMPDNVGREKTKPGQSILSGATSLGVGSAHAFAIMQDGKLRCWGQNNAGACGWPSKTRYAPRPQPVPALKDIVMVRAGESRSCAIDKQGTLICWGGSSWDPDKPPAPVALPGAATEVVVGSGSHVCVRVADGSVYCWGQNDHGELGDGTTTERSSPVKVKGLPAAATALSAGLERTCAIVTGGRVFCWGVGASHRDKSMPVEDSSVPVEVARAK